MKPQIKVLVVEDEQIVALDLKRRLSKLGYRVTGTAASAEKALALLEKELPDVVLMDINIQGELDGIQTTAIIQQDYHVPVIYLTAYSEEKTLSRARETHPYGYLLKPFSERELHVMIQVTIERYQADIKLKKNEEHLNLALDAARLGTWEISDDSREIFIGKSPRGTLLPVSNWERFYGSIIDADKDSVEQAITTLRKQSDSALEIEFRVKCGGKADCWYKLYGKSFGDDGHQDHRIVGVLQDTTDLHNVEDKLVQAATVFECTAEGIVILDKDRNVDCANEAFYKITGFQAPEIEGKPLNFLSRQFLDVETRNKIWSEVKLHGQWQGEIKTLKKNDDLMYAWLNIGIVPGPEQDVLQYVLVISDITAIREAQDRLSRLAYFDSLTDLPNRMLILDRLKQALAKAKRNISRVAVLFVDLDNFKRINDTMGHQVGDAMLRSVSSRLESVLRTSDTLGRLGGDEFVVIMEDVESRDAVTVVAEKLLSSLAQPLNISNTEIVPTCSIGVSMFPDDSANHDELLQMADTAMYAAKNEGRNRFALYSPGMTQATAHYLTRERELQKALAADEFVLQYQPQCSIREGRVTGVEALIRWQHPERGLMAPAEIVPIAETSDLILDIGNWVLDEACRQLAEWRSAGLLDIRMAVNLSVRQLRDDQLPGYVEKLLNQYEIPPHQLEIEITESSLQSNDSNVLSLQRLENLGVGISIDDFGTGYSCMSSLKYLPIKRLKIDQAFVRDIPHDVNDCAIASAILALGHQLNMQVIAEGVETRDQLEFLSAIGCDELQGFFFSRAVNAQELPDLIVRLGEDIEALSYQMVDGLQ